MRLKLFTFYFYFKCVFCYVFLKKRSRGDAVNEQEQESPIPIEEANQQQEKEEEEVEEKKGLKETNQPEESTLVLSGTEVEIINTKSSPVEHVQIPETEDGSGMEEMPALCDGKCWRE